MNRWVNIYSVMLISISYNDALNDARIMVEELEKNLKKQGYLSDEYYVKFNMKEFIPGNPAEDDCNNSYAQTSDWEIEISFPTGVMEKTQAKKMAEIGRYQLEKACKELKYLIFQTIKKQNLGYIKFDQCRLMSDDDEEHFRYPDI